MTMTLASVSSSAKSPIEVPCASPSWNNLLPIYGKWGQQPPAVCCREPTLPSWGVSTSDDWVKAGWKGPPILTREGSLPPELKVPVSMEALFHFCLCPVPPLSPHFLEGLIPNKPLAPPTSSQNLFLENMICDIPILHTQDRGGMPPVLMKRGWMLI